MDYVFPTFVRSSTDDVAATNAALESTNTPKKSLLELVIEADGQLGLVPQRERAKRPRQWDAQYASDDEDNNNNNHQYPHSASAAFGRDENDEAAVAVLATRTSWIPPTYVMDHCFTRAFFQAFADLHGLRFHPIGPTDMLLPPPPIFYLRDLRLPSVLQASLLQRLQPRYGGGSNNGNNSVGAAGRRGAGGWRQGSARGGAAQTFSATPAPMSFDDVAKAAELRDLLLHAGPVMGNNDDDNDECDDNNSAARSRTSRSGPPRPRDGQCEEGAWLRPLQQVGLPSMLLGHHTILAGPHQSGKTVATCLSLGLHALRTYTADMEAAATAEAEEEAHAHEHGDRNEEEEARAGGEERRPSPQSSSSSSLASLPRAVLLVPTFNDIRECAAWMSDVFGPHAFRFYTISQDGADVLPYQSDLQKDTLEREAAQAEAEEEARWRAQAAAEERSEKIANLLNVIEVAAADLPVISEAQESGSASQRERQHGSDDKDDDAGKYDESRDRRRRSRSSRDRDRRRRRRHDSSPHSSDDSEDAHRRRRRRRRHDDDDDEDRDHRSSRRHRHRHRRHHTHSRSESDSPRSRGGRADDNDDDRDRRRSSRHDDRSRRRHRHRREDDSASRASRSASPASERRDRVRSEEPERTTLPPMPVVTPEPTTASSAVRSWLPAYLRRGCPVLLTTGTAFQRAVEANDGRFEALRLELVRTCAVVQLERWLQPPLMESFPASHWMRLCTAMDVECQFLFTVRRALKSTLEFVRNTVLPDVGASTRVAAAAARHGDDDDEYDKDRDGAGVDDDVDMSARLIVWEQTDETIWELIHLNVQPVAVEAITGQSSSATAAGSAGGGPRVSMEEIDVAKTVQAASMVMEFFMARGGDAPSEGPSLRPLIAPAITTTTFITPPAPPALPSHRYLQPPPLGPKDDDPTAAPPNPTESPPPPPTRVPPAAVVPTRHDRTETGAPDEIRSSWQGPAVVIFTGSRREQQLVETQLTRLLRDGAGDRRAALIRVGTSCEGFTRGELEVLIVTDTQMQDARETRTLATYMRTLPELVLHFSLPRVALHGSLEEMKECVAVRQRAVCGHTHKALNMAQGKGKIPSWILLTEHHMNGRVGTKVMEMLSSVS